MFVCLSALSFRGGKHTCDNPGVNILLWGWPSGGEGCQPLWSPGSEPPVGQTDSTAACQPKGSYIPHVQLLLQYIQLFGTSSCVVHPAVWSLLRTSCPLYCMHGREYTEDTELKCQQITHNWIRLCVSNNIRLNLILLFQRDIITFNEPNTNVCKLLT